MHLRGDILLAAVGLALVAGTAQACPNHTVKTTAAVTPPTSHAAVVAWKPRAWTPVAPSARQAQGMRVAIDPVDGTMSMPAADDATQLVIIDDGAPIPMRTRANGSRFAMLDDRFAEYSMASVGPDGRPSWTCVHGPQGAEQFMKKPVVTSKRAMPTAPAPGTVWEVK